jgi:hypothetical protein
MNPSTAVIALRTSDTEQLRISGSTKLRTIHSLGRELARRSFFLYQASTSGVAYCSKCGAQNPDDAKFCAKCGSPLASASPPPASPASSGTGPNPAQGKSAGLAAFLNLFFGLGYIYLGYSKVMGVPTIVFVVLALVVYALIGFVTLGIVTLILAILLAVDGYQKGSGQRGFVSAQ